MLQTLFFVVYTLLFIEVRAKSISLSLEISYKDYFNSYLSLKSFFFFFFWEKDLFLQVIIKVHNKKIGTEAEN